MNCLRVSGKERRTKMMQRVERVAVRYSDALHKNPIKIKLMTNFCLGCLGDFICQASMRYRLRDDFMALTEYNLHEWSPVRTLRQGTVGMLFCVLPMHYWLMKVVPYLNISKSLISSPGLHKASTIAYRLGVHTLIITPYMQAAMLFGIGTFKGLSINSGVQLFQERFYDGVQFAFCFWPFVALGLYTVVPLRFGNLYMDCFALLWQICISFVANKKASEQVPSWGLFYRTLKGKFSGGSPSCGNNKAEE